jgi:hypothetical protein
MIDQQYEETTSRLALDSGLVDWLGEDIVTFGQAAECLPRRRRGRKIHVSTFYRWSTVGCRGIILETIQVGATRCTSREALKRFFERLSQPVQASAASPPVGRVRTPTQRQRDSAEAGRKLAERGA